MLKVSWDVSIQGCHWQPLSIHQSRYMYLLRVVTGQFKYQPLFCLETEIVRLWFLMTFAGVLYTSEVPKEVRVNSYKK